MSSVVANCRALRSRLAPTDAALGGSAALRRVRNEAELASSNIDTWCLPYAAFIRRKNRVGTCARECEVAQACSRAHLSPKKMATAKRQRLDELGGEQIDSSNDQTDILDVFVLRSMLRRRPLASVNQTLYSITLSTPLLISHFLLTPDYHSPPTASSRPLVGSHSYAPARSGCSTAPQSLYSPPLRPLHSHLPLHLRPYPSAPPQS